MLSETRLKLLKKKKIISGPKTAILGPQFCRILVLGLIFGGQGAGPPAPPGSAPELTVNSANLDESLLTQPCVAILTCVNNRSIF